jgi:hypothetical protein
MCKLKKTIILFFGQTEFAVAQTEMLDSPGGDNPFPGPFKSFA